MDSITQAALGAVIGELTLGKKLGWRGAAWGAFFGTLPDLDVVVMPFLSEAARFTWHRGYSHSILFWFLGSLVLAPLLARLHRKRGLSFGRAYLFLFLTFSTHALIDCFTTYGTQILEPFSSARVAFNNIYIIDLFFTLPMLLSLALVFFFQPESQKRRQINAVFLTMSCLYVVLSFGMKGWATRTIQAQMEEMIPGAKLVATAPTLSNILLWRGLIETPEALWVTYWSPFDTEPCRFDYHAKNHELLPPQADNQLLDNVLWFTRGYNLVRQNNLGQATVIDMRFNEVHDPTNQAIVPIFQWHLEADESGKIIHAPQRRPDKLDYSAALKLTFARLRGQRDVWDQIPTKLVIAEVPE